MRRWWSMSWRRASLFAWQTRAGTPRSIHFSNFLHPTMQQQLEEAGEAKGGTGAAAGQFMW